MITIHSAIESFLGNVTSTQAAHTAKSYRADLLGSTGFLHGMASQLPASMPVQQLQDEMAVQYFQKLITQNVAAATFQRRVSTMREFFRFLEALKWSDVSADRLKSLLKAGKLKPKAAPPQIFDLLEPKIKRVLEHALAVVPQGEESDRLIQLRDKAFVIVLADTGARVHEACKLKRGDINWTKSKATIIGKGDKEGILRFSARALSSIQIYLQARAVIDGASGLPLSTLPVFARHDDGGQKRVKPIAPSTGEEIVHRMARSALGADYDGKITAHKFRHYFVTMVLSKTDNLKMAQEMARHKNIGTTQRYGHVNEGTLDEKHKEIFC